MKIILINNLYGEYARGGAERLVDSQATSLHEQGNEVLVISGRPMKHTTTPAPPQGGDFLATTSNRKPGVRCQMFYPWNIISYYHLNKLPLALRLVWHAIDMFNVQSYFTIKKILKRERPEAVITHNLKGVGLLTPLAIKHAGVKKHIHTLHDIQLLHPSGLMFAGEEKKVDNVLARMYQRANKKLFARADAVVSPSRWLLDEHVKRGFFDGVKTCVLRNPSATTPDLSLPTGQAGSRRGKSVEYPGQDFNRAVRQDFSPSKGELEGVVSENNSWNGGGKEELNQKKRFVFLYAGQMEHHKGVHVLIEAFKELQKDKGEVQLRLIGDGSLKEKLQAQAQPLGDAVTFLPWDHERYQRELATAGCLVMPSICYENSPTVIIDALAAGTPVVASAIGGVPELLENGGGTMCTAGDAAALASMMKKAMDHEQGVPVAAGQVRQTIDGYVEKLLQLC